MTERYEYKVLELREVILNEHAAQGWRLKAITSADVKGHVGRGGVERLLVMFGRVRGQPHAFVTRNQPSTDDWCVRPVRDG